MATAFYSSYKPQILSRQEGFHLPSPAPSTPPSSDSTPSSVPNGSSSSNAAFDTNNLFMAPPSYLSVPETFRKFPSSGHDSSGPNPASMDFSDELASLISHERSTQSPVSVSGYDDYSRPTTHNIFDISAPTSHHHHSSHSPHSPYPPAGSAFSLPPASTTAHGLHTPGSSLQTPTHPLHEFTSHFNSTVPAIGSSMRSNGPSTHPFALNVNTSGSSANNHPNSPSTSSATGNEPSSFSSHGFSDSFAHLHGPRQTPSPVLPPSSSGRDYAQRGDEFSRSRSRSRSTAQPPADPPSTHGGPARTARTTRPKRGSVSSVSPPPLHRGLTQPLVIPSASPAPTAGPRSPLSLHTSGWFGGPGSLGGMTGLNGYGLNSINSLQGMGEFSLPTPDSVHGHTLFGSVHQGSPKELGLSGSLGNGGLGSSLGGTAKADSPTDDLSSKQAQIANEKRRRRRESHNAVERRRRDNINEKISELATLIPECLLDPNSTMTMPATLSSATSEDLLLTASASLATTNSNAPIGSAEGGKKEEALDDKDGEGAGQVKANKGMILRKSVDYIRYLQQLVSAQASRNRELEQQLHAYRGNSSGSGASSSGAEPSASGSSEDDALMLHEEIDDFSLAGLNGHHPSEASPARSFARRGASASVSRKKFGGFELESVAEMEQDTDHHDQHEDHEMDRPSTAGTGASPLSGSGSDDVEHDGEEEEERGRKGRDGRPMGYGGLVNLKVEEGMETC
ncbi:helix-loop-helix DNA-binding domain-containing protein [Cytidiella melzeri]|nr:helix-loop-helix DNA-binding domain-containing protein [Cytidiella melzeri]